LQAVCHGVPNRNARRMRKLGADAALLATHVRNPN
jgi:hypothetical protein